MRQRWRLADYNDVVDVSSRLRAEDWREAFILTGEDPRYYLPANFNRGTTYVIFNSQGENVALAGVDDVGSGHGLIWMVATPSLLNHQIEFLKHSKAWIEEVTRPYSLVGNLVHAENKVHLRWLQWCGFTFLRKVEAGKPPATFIEFVRITPCA